MIHITIKGYIKSIERKDSFTIMLVQQKNHPSDKYKVSISNDKVDMKHIIPGMVIDCECNLRGMYPFNNIYCNFCNVAHTFKELDIDNDD